MENKEKMSHDEFVLAKNKEKVNIMFNDEEILNAGIDMHGGVEIKEKTDNFLKFKKSGVYVWTICVLSLFTPLKMIIFCGLIYWALKHFIFSSLKSNIVSEMMKNEEFYNKAIENKLVYVSLK